MSENAYFLYLNHIDAPKRYFSFTLDEAAVAVLGVLLLVMSNKKATCVLLCAGLIGLMRLIKRGQGLSIYLVLAYWYLPNSFTQFFLPKLPASHQRIWIS